MSEPTPDTVREWLAAIFNKPGGGGSDPELLAEIRYLNQGLFGSTAQLPAQNPPNGLLAELFTAQRKNWWTGATEVVGIAKLLAGTGEDEYAYDAAGYLGEIRDAAFQLQAAIGIINQPGFTVSDQLVEMQTLLGRDFNQSGPGPITFSYQTLVAILAALGELGQNGGPLTAREYLAGILVQTTRQADCCEESSGGAGSPPAWSAAICPNHPLLTATFTFTGEITASGALATGLTLASSPPNFTTDPGDNITGPLLRYTSGQIGTCWTIAVDPAYTGTVGANITIYTLPTYGAPDGRSDPPDLAPGPETFTMFEDADPPTEVGIAYGVGIAVGPGDPPLMGSQVVVYVGRPDPNA